MTRRVTVLGGGHGVASVLSALRADCHRVTAIVTVADDGGSSGALRRRIGGAGVGDVRRALIALTGEENPMAAALARKVEVDSLGWHPVGNIVLSALTQTLGDLQAASDWLGERLRAPGRIVAATVEPVSLTAEVHGALIVGESAIGAAGARIARVGFCPDLPQVSPSALAAVADADCILLGPGSLYTSILAVCALPGLAAALADTPAQVIWICNLSPEPGETPELSAAEHLAALRRHGVRVDAVLQDREAKLHLTPGELADDVLSEIARPMRGGEPHLHDIGLLRLALRDVVRGATSGRALPSAADVMHAPAWLATGPAPLEPVVGARTWTRRRRRRVAAGG
ncbi:MAG: uridine diphosphate-N-acetylglucosamine-binding protein YvcK [Solirubrobacteraceae bacterium]